MDLVQVENSTESVIIPEYMKYEPIIPASYIHKIDREDVLLVLQEIGRIISIYNGFDTEIAKTDEEIKKEEWNKNRIGMKLSPKAKMIYRGLLIVCGFSGWMVAFVLSGGSVLLGLIGVVIMLIMAYMIRVEVIGPMDRNFRGKEIAKEEEEYQKTMIDPLYARKNDLIARKNEMANSPMIQWAYDVIGEDMFDIDSIQMLYNIIKSRRADTLKEALNKLDDEFHKARMEQMQQDIKNAAEKTATEAAKQTAHLKEVEQSAKETAAAARQTAAATTVSALADYDAYKTRQQLKKKYKL